MSRSLLVLVGLVSVSLAYSNVWAVAKGPKKPDQAMAFFNPDSVVEKAEYPSSAFSSHLGDVDRYMNAFVRQEQDSRSVEAKKSKVAKLAAEQKARDSKAELLAILKQDNAEITKKETKFAQVKGRINELEEFTNQADVNPDELKKLKKERDELEGFFKSAQRPSRKDPGTYSPGGMQANEKLKKSLDEATAKKADFDDKYKKLESALNGSDKLNFQNEGFAKGIDEMFSRMKDNYYDARLLLTDFDTLKAKHDITGLRLEILKAKVEDRMNKTLLGSYVNEQINKALSKICELQKQCVSENGMPKAATDLSKSLEGIAVKVDETAPGNKAGKASE